MVSIREACTLENSACGRVRQNNHKCTKSALTHRTILLSVPFDFNLICSCTLDEKSDLTQYGRLSAIGEQYVVSTNTAIEFHTSIRWRFLQTAGPMRPEHAASTSERQLRRQQQKQQQQHR